MYYLTFLLCTAPLIGTFGPLTIQQITDKPTASLYTAEPCVLLQQDGKVIMKSSPGLWPLDLARVAVQQPISQMPTIEPQTSDFLFSINRRRNCRPCPQPQPEVIPARVERHSPPPPEPSGWNFPFILILAGAAAAGYFGYNQVEKKYGT